MMLFLAILRMGRAGNAPVMEAVTWLITGTWCSKGDGVVDLEENEVGLHLR